MTTMVIFSIVTKSQDLLCGNTLFVIHLQGGECKLIKIYKMEQKPNQNVNEQYPFKNQIFFKKHLVINAYHLRCLKQRI